MVIKFFSDYGWIMTVLATSGILFIGVLKSMGIFDKLNGKIKKYVYFGLSCVISIIVCTVYLCATDSFDWKEWGITIACIIPYTLAIYGLYENTGLRSMLKKILFEPVKALVQRLIALIKKGSFEKEEIKDAFESFVEDVVSDITEVLEDSDRQQAGSSENDTDKTVNIKNDGSEDLNETVAILPKEDAAENKKNEIPEK